MAPIDYFSRLISAFRPKEEKKPVFSPWYAAGLSILFTLIYIVPFYLSAATRPSPQLSRDAPSSIRARIRAVTFSSLISGSIAIYLIRHYTGASLAESVSLLGWWPAPLLEATKTVLLTAILFAGPLFEAGIVDGGLKRWIKGRALFNTLGDWIGIRNYIAGPVTEELIWRSILIPLHLLAHVPPSRIVFLTPLYFGIAHVHHYYEFRLTHPNTPTLPAILRSLFQFTYTSLFGFYAAFVFLRNRNVLGLILAHSFCNWMGLPRFWGRVGEDTDTEAAGMAPHEEERGRERERKPGGPQRHVQHVPRLSTGWTVAYYVILVAGTIGFYYQLYPLTKSERALAKFE